MSEHYVAMLIDHLHDHGPNLEAIGQQAYEGGGFKTELSHAKSSLFIKKRVHGLPAELLSQEAVI